MLKRLFFFACLTGVSHAEPITFTVHSSPPGAKVYAHLPGLQTNLNNPGVTIAEPTYLGLAGQPLTLDVSAYQGKDAMQRIEVPLELRLDGHENTTVFANNDLKQYKRWPVKGEIPLKPDNLGVAAKDFLAAYGLLLLALTLGGAGLAVYALKQQRARQSAEEARQELENLTIEGDPYVGTLVGEYRILDRLGAGGMAVVYRGKRNKEPEVAIKLMAPHLTADEEFPARFKREVQAYMQLDHPNIVRLVDWGTQPMFLAMELIHGGTLRDQITRTGMGIPQFIQTFVPLLDAIAYAHSRGLIHRDLKPENIMLHRGKLLKVMDFGLARGQQVSSKITASGCALGTPAYMAPEQIEGATATSADQYSLGVIAFELLTGMVPFSGETMQVLMGHLNTPRPKVSDYAKAVPPRLDALVTRMMARDPDARYASVASVLAELESMFPHLTS